MIGCGVRPASQQQLIKRYRRPHPGFDVLPPKQPRHVVAGEDDISRQVVNMDDEPTEADRKLLERLNALKPSSVQLDRRKCAPISC